MVPMAIYVIICICVYENTRESSFQTRKETKGRLEVVLREQGGKRKEGIRTCGA